MSIPERFQDWWTSLGNEGRTALIKEWKRDSSGHKYAAEYVRVAEYVREAHKRLLVEQVSYVEDRYDEAVRACEVYEGMVKP